MPSAQIRSNSNTNKVNEPMQTRTGATTRSKGNLQTMLSSYEQSQSQSTNNDAVSLEDGNSPSDISIQLDAIGRERSSTLGSFRDRGLTFGSVTDFDLDLGFGDHTAIAVPGGGVIEFTTDNAAETAHGSVAAAGSGSGTAAGHTLANGTSSAKTNTGVSGTHGNGHGNAQLAMNIVSANSSNASGAGFMAKNGFAGMELNIVQAQAHPQSQSQSHAQYEHVSAQSAQYNTQRNADGNRSRSGSGSGNAHQGGSASIPAENIKNETNSFFSGMFGTNANDKSGTALLGHTPPTAMATSYEGRHFGKRMRAGSISGRLRSMSDLEDRGIIDRQQKGVLKDLIISGDDDLQLALDKWDGGDKTALESIVSTLKTKNSSDIDLLGDLDLDFLSMGNADFGVGDDSHSHGHGRIASKSMSILIPGKAMPMDIHMEGSNPGSGASTPHMRDPSPAPMAGQGGYDGIGELDFNGDYTGGAEQTPYQQSAYNQHLEQVASSSSSEPQVQSQSQSQIQTQQQAHPQPQGYSTGTKFRSDSLVEFQRNRANSLAFGILLDEDEPSTHEFQEHDFPDSVGKWMDRTPGSIPEERQPPKKRASSHIVGANGGLYIINDPNNDGHGQEMDIDTSKMTKAEIAAMKRRDREEKKAQREADKIAKKERKEHEALLKKANKTSKYDKKTKKGETTKKKKDDAGSDEEPKVIISGTGRPRSLSDPNLSIGLDEHGLMHIDHPPDWVGAYSPDSRKLRIERFLSKRNHRVWVKKVKYDVRKNFADSRLRVKGRFVKKEDELLMRDLMSLT